VEELLIAALVGILVSWFILDQKDAEQAPKPPAVEESGPGATPPSAPPLQPPASNG
jgi:hypothetical protein